MKTRAVVFAHHDVGVRCLAALLSAELEVPLVFAHDPDAGESRWYGSVADSARDAGVPCVTTENPHTGDWPQRIAELAPDFIFSFYYRSMLSPGLLQLARRGAFNMHGSLLPKYRGRAPVNWAILRGETWTGATLHHMVERADAGDIVDQLAVPILQNDDSREVYAKITVAAETVLARSLPGLIAGTARRTPQDLRQGSYCGRRGPEDGLIDWGWSAARIHNLVRALAPPFPGAFGDIAGQRWWIHRSRVLSPAGATRPSATLRTRASTVLVECCDGSTLQLLDVALPGNNCALERLAQLCGAEAVVLTGSGSPH